MYLSTLSKPSTERGIDLEFQQDLLDGLRRPEKPRFEVLSGFDETMSANVRQNLPFPPAPHRSHSEASTSLRQLILEWALLEDLNSEMNPNWWLVNHALRLS